MKITNAEVITIIRNINAANELVENSFPIKFAWAFQKNVKKINELAEMVNSKLNSIEQKYADDEHSQDVTQTNAEGKETTARIVKPDYVEEFQKAKNEFFALENEIDIEKFSVDELGDIKISLNTINALDFMLE